MRRSWIALILATLLAGCVAAPTQYISNAERGAEPGSLKTGAATVYIARTNGVLVWAPMIKVDSVEQGTLDKLSYLHFIAPPGRHLIAFHWNPASLMPDGSVNVELQADKTYYFEFGYEVLGMSGRTFMRMVDRSTGEAMIADCKCQDSSILQAR
jgi:hypothetical protein